MAPEVGFEPTTNRLTADRSTTELLRSVVGQDTNRDLGRFKRKLSPFTVMRPDGPSSEASPLCLFGREASSFPHFGHGKGAKRGGFAYRRGKAGRFAYYVSNHPRWQSEPGRQSSHLTLR
jgi:hypothetical protein